MLEHFTQDSHSRASIPGLYSPATFYVPLVKSTLPRAEDDLNRCPPGSIGFVPLFVSTADFRTERRKAPFLPRPDGRGLQALQR